MKYNMLLTSLIKLIYVSTDMDDTLYPRSCGINLACRKKIEGKV